MRYAVILGLVAIGCAHARGSWEVDAALARAQTELACPRSELTGEFLGGGGVVVRGCGLSRSYTCLRRLCQPDGAAVGAHAASDAVPVPTEDQRAGNAAVAACTIAPGAHIVFYVGVDGTVLRVESGDDPAGARACVEQALTSVTFATREDADRVEIAIASPVTQLDTTPTPEPLVRVLIDARRDSILLCNGGQPTAVVGEWTAEGAVSLRLPDARVGSPEDGCVRATATGARIEPAPGVAGSLLHPVQ